jgi:hypothetical protein
MEANYTPGRGRGPGSGWGGLGYGGFQGAMAYQGVLAYFYDQIYPGHVVELDVCRWNQVVADIVQRGGPHQGQCRQYPRDGNHTTNTLENGKCEDCRVTPVEETMTVHFTACNKPWECMLPDPDRQRWKRNNLTSITTCGLLFHKYFDIRQEIESKIANRLGVANFTAPNGTFYPDYYNGYCRGNGFLVGNSYISMADLLPLDDFNMSLVYGF